MACRVGPDHWRQRKTGPRFALLVMRCRSHQLGFTLYPPGHVPYGRRSVAPVGADGQLLDPAADVEPVERFGTTTFEAAIDLAAGRRWPRSWERVRDDPTCPEHTTQWRWIGRLARLVGIASVLDERTRHAVSSALGIATLLVCDQVRSTTDLATLAGAVVALLRHLPQHPTVLDALLVSGAEGGLWGRPHRWDPTSRVVRALVVPSGGTRDPP